MKLLLLAMLPLAAFALAAVALAAAPSKTSIVLVHGAFADASGWA